MTNIQGRTSVRQVGINADPQTNETLVEADHAHDTAELSNVGRTSVRHVGQTADQPTSHTNENEQNIALGWNDIQHLTAGDTDTTQATGPVERTIIYEAPIFKPIREEGYAMAWKYFELNKE